MTGGRPRNTRRAGRPRPKVKPPPVPFAKAIGAVHGAPELREDGLPNFWNNERVTARFYRGMYTMHFGCVTAWTIVLGLLAFFRFFTDHISACVDVRVLGHPTTVEISTVLFLPILAMILYHGWFVIAHPRRYSSYFLYGMRYHSSPVKYAAYSFCRAATIMALVLVLGLREVFFVSMLGGLSTLGHVLLGWMDLANRRANRPNVVEAGVTWWPVAAAALVDSAVLGIMGGLVRLNQASGRPVVLGSDAPRSPQEATAAFVWFLWMGGIGESVAMWLSMWIVMTEHAMHVVQSVGFRLQTFPFGDYIYNEIGYTVSRPIVYAAFVVCIFVAAGPREEDGECLDLWSRE